MPTQTPLPFPSVGKDNESTPVKNPRKRTITTATGEDVDLTKQFSASSAVIEAMRQRIFQLEDQLESSAKEPPAKRARTTAAAASTSAPAPAPTAAATKAADKKHAAQLKKIFDSLKKECKSDSVKFQGSSKTIKTVEIFEQDEFESMFSGQGNLIQPTATNKPGSTVTIIQFSRQQVLDFFGSEYKGLKGNAWTIGGGSSFAKSNKIGACDVEILSMDVNYSKNSMKCTIKCDVDAPGVRGTLGASQKRSGFGGGGSMRGLFW